MLLVPQNVFVLSDGDLKRQEGLFPFGKIYLLVSFEALSKVIELGQSQANAGDVDLFFKQDSDDNFGYMEK